MKDWPARRCHLMMFALAALVSALLLQAGLAWTPVRAFGRTAKPIAPLTTATPPPTPRHDGVPARGIIDYIGNTTSASPFDANSAEESRAQALARWSSLQAVEGNNLPPQLRFQPLTAGETLSNSFAFWRQLPWKKIGGRVVLRCKLGGELPLEKTSRGGLLSSLGSGSGDDASTVPSLEEATQMFMAAAVDQRVVAIFVEITPIACGYARLLELTKAMRYFQDSGKKIYAYFAGGSEKEFFVARTANELFVPPDGSLDLRGFVGGAQFFRGIFDKVGVEPQVQRIGKYKSFGDTFNRSTIAEAQREVVSSLLMESSDYWVDTIALELGKSRAEVLSLWGADATLKTPAEYKQLGYVDGVNYLDAVEDRIMDDCKAFAPYASPLAFFKNLVVDGWDFQRHLTETTSRRPHLVSGLARNASSAFSKAFESGRYDNFTSAVAAGGDWADFDLEKAVGSQPRRDAARFAEALAAATASAASADAEQAPLSTADAVTDADAENKEEKKEEEKEEEEEEGDDEKAKSKRRIAFLPAGLYLRKIRKLNLKGMPYRERRSGRRVAIINAVGGIGPGQSSNSARGRSIGSDTLIEQLRRCAADPLVTAVVLRVDSPGGSALASDLAWRELRALAKKKPVVASMVDVAASGGYYLSMGCDLIFASDTTVTGSIGVVTAKFNIAELADRVGLSTEILSRGTYAEALASTRGFTESEEAYFAKGAQAAYESFITKAAASRSFPSVAAMNEVAQGRVWTGKQALQRGLVDAEGGLWEAVYAASVLAEADQAKAEKAGSGGGGSNWASKIGRALGKRAAARSKRAAQAKRRSGSREQIAVQVIRESPRGLSLSSLSGLRAPLPGLGAAAGFGGNDVSLVLDDVVAGLGLASPGALGVPASLLRFGLGPQALAGLGGQGGSLGLGLAGLLSSLGLGGGEGVVAGAGAGGVGGWEAVWMALEDLIDGEL